jgi:hypothetical protein
MAILKFVSENNYFKHVRKADLWIEAEQKKVGLQVQHFDRFRHPKLEIQLFKQNSEDMTTLMKQQLSVLKSSLEAINDTLANV